MATNSIEGVRWYHLTVPRKLRQVYIVQKLQRCRGSPHYECLAGLKSLNPRMRDRSGLRQNVVLLQDEAPGKVPAREVGLSLMGGKRVRGGGPGHEWDVQQGDLLLWNCRSQSNRSREDYRSSDRDDIHRIGAVRPNDSLSRHERCVYRSRHNGREFKCSEPFSRFTTVCWRANLAGMAQTVCVIVSPLDRQMLEAIVADRNRPQKHVERARVVLASAERDPVQRVAARLGVSRPMVWRWQQRFAEEGVDGSAARQDAQARQAADCRRDGGARAWR